MLGVVEVSSKLRHERMPYLKQGDLYCGSENDDGAGTLHCWKTCSIILFVTFTDVRTLIAKV